MIDAPVEEQRIYRIRGRTSGVVRLGDHWAIVAPDQRTEFLEAGIVFVHPIEVWGDRLEGVEVSPDEIDALETTETYDGAVRDRRLADFALEMQGLIADRTVEDDDRYRENFDSFDEADIELGSG